VLCILGHCVKNLLMRIRSAAPSAVNTQSGARLKNLDVGAAVSYVETVFSRYKILAGIKRFHGRVAEIGPGDNCGVGLMLLADGCEQVDLADRFFSIRDDKKNTDLYKSLQERHPSLQSIVRVVDDRIHARGLSISYGPEAAAEQFFRTPSVYDFIVSAAVLEHLSNPVQAIKCMVRSLKEGGRMIHVVDLRDHGMFSKRFHELKFLEVPELVYPQMVNCSGKPNRVLINDYRQALDALPVEYTLFVGRLAGIGPIEPMSEWSDIPDRLKEQSRQYVRAVKPAFARRIRAITDDDLCITFFALVATKRRQQ
jgi:SAM-dependent methyltransferase